MKPSIVGVTSRIPINPRARSRASARATRHDLHPPALLAKGPLEQVRRQAPMGDRDIGRRIGALGASPSRRNFGWLNGERLPSGRVPGRTAASWRSPLDGARAKSYAITVTRSRTRAAWMLLALLVLGVGASAGVALAAGSGCCPEMSAAGKLGDPCHSLAPITCCQERAELATPSGPGPAVLDLPGAPALQARVRTAQLVPHSTAPAAAQLALASTVLRL